MKGDNPRAESEIYKDDNVDKEVKENEIDSGTEETQKEESDKTKSSVHETTAKDDSNNFSDLDELLFCRSPNQIKVMKII